MRADVRMRDTPLAEGLKAQAAAANRWIMRDLRELGLIIEYDHPSDFVYISIGETRGGLALRFWDATIVLERETFDLVGVEVPLFKARSVRGELARWDCLSAWTKVRGALYVGFRESPKDFGPISTVIEGRVIDPFFDGAR